MNTKSIIILVATVFINTLILGIYNHKDHQKIIEKLSNEIKERK